jgi:hypothetical protein
VLFDQQTTGQVRYSGAGFLSFDARLDGAEPVNATAL